MNAIQSTLADAYRTLLDQTGDAAVLLILTLVFIAVFLAALYVFNRKPDEADSGEARAGADYSTPPSQFTAQPQQSEGVEVFPAGQLVAQLSPERKAFLKSLDSVEQVLARIYLVLMYGVLAAATFAMAWLYFKYPNDGHRDFMLFYGGVIYLAAVLGIGAQIANARRRLHPRSETAVFAELAPKLQITVQSTTPDVGFIDQAAIERARRHLAAGGTLDEACALVDARYEHMSGWTKTAFRKAVQTMLEHDVRSASRV